MLKKSTLGVGIASVLLGYSVSFICGVPNGFMENDADGSTCAGSVPVGIAVDTAIRNAMQAELFGASNGCVGSDSLLCMPGISSAELSRLMSGTVTSVSSLVSGLGTDSLTTCGLDPTLPSGQAGLNKTLGSSTSEGSVAGVVSCMTPVPGALPFLPTSRRVGIVPLTESSSDFRFVKLDGVAPIVSEHLSANYNLIANYAGTAVSGDFTVTEQPFGNVRGGLVSEGAPTKSISNECNAVAPMIAPPMIMPDTPSPS